jgi:hypothetical protein
MSKPQTIPEFLGILAGTIVVMSVIGALIIRLFQKAPKIFKNKPISNSIKSPKINKTPAREIMENQQSIEEIAKFKINGLFYKYCFSTETAKIFLEENDMRPTIARALYLSVLDKEKFLELTFKLFLKKAYRIELETIGHKFYKYNGYKFYLDSDRIDIDGEVTFFEILRNGIEDVIDKDGSNCLIANEFIVYVKDTLPIALFVIITDSLINKIVIREVLKDGLSYMITDLDTNEDNEAIDFLKDFVGKR